MVYQDVDHTICSVGKNGVLGARWFGINWCWDDHGHFMKIRWLHDPGCFMTHQPCVSMLSQLLTKETTMSNHMLLNLSHVFRGSNPCKGWLNPHQTEGSQGVWSLVSTALSQQGFCNMELRNQDIADFFWWLFLYKNEAMTGREGGACKNVDRPKMLVQGEP